IAITSVAVTFHAREAALPDVAAVTMRLHDRRTHTVDRPLATRAGGALQVGVEPAHGVGVERELGGLLAEHDFSPVKPSTVEGARRLSNGHTARRGAHEREHLRGNPRS